MLIRFLLTLVLSLFMGSQTSANNDFSKPSECSNPTKKILAVPTKANLITGQSPHNKSSLVVKLAQRRTINPTLAWHTEYMKRRPGDYKLGWTGARGHLQRDWGDALKLAAPHWNYNFTTTPLYSDWLEDGHSKFLTDISWSHDDEYGKTLALDITHPDFAKSFVEEIRLTNEASPIDGVMLDWWHTGHQVPWKRRLHQILPEIAESILEEFGDDFLILGNVNWERDKRLVQNLNGVFLELYKTPYERVGPYTCSEIRKIEQLIKFHEKNLRPPKIIALNPWRITDRKLHSHKDIICDRLSRENLQYSRLFAAMSSVLVDNGYIEYSDNNPDFADTDHRAAYYPVYDVDLGKPVSQSVELGPGVSMKYYEHGLMAFNRTTSHVELTLDGSKVELPAMDAIFLDENSNVVFKNFEEPDACAEGAYAKISPIPVSLPKYDRTLANLRKKFDCLRQALSEEALKTYPTEKEIADLIVGLKDNKFYRTKRHLVKLGLAKEIVEEHKVNLLRLVNFEGTNEAYCEKPIR